MKRVAPLRIWSLFNPADVTMLRTSTAPVDLNLTDRQDFQLLIDAMIATMRRAEGIGLAAPQIGQSTRIAVISEAVDRQLNQPLVLVNPHLTNPSPQQLTEEEGCLSIPDVFGLVSRPAEITVLAFDRRGAKFTLPVAGLLARVIQHEIDHLNGVLFIDHATSYTRGQELLP